MTNTDRERIIREAIAARQAEGWTIVSGLTRGFSVKMCCPLGAITTGWHEAIQPTDGWIASFISGVDGDLPNYVSDPEAYALGLKFKEEFGL